MFVRVGIYTRSAKRQCLNFLSTSNSTSGQGTSAPSVYLPRRITHKVMFHFRMWLSMTIGVHFAGTRLPSLLLGAEYEADFSMNSYVAPLKLQSNSAIFLEFLTLSFPVIPYAAPRVSSTTHGTSPWALVLLTTPCMAPLRLCLISRLSRQSPRERSRTRSLLPLQPLFSRLWF